ncbi:hypothetical protein Tco_0928365 [Tanacetum coccineum]
MASKAEAHLPFVGRTDKVKEQTTSLQKDFHEAQPTHEPIILVYKFSPRDMASVVSEVAVTAAAADGWLSVAAL